MTFIDYKGPTGAYIATGTRIIPLTSTEGAAALGHSAMLSALGTGEDAKRYEHGMRQALDEAHKLDTELGLGIARL